MDYFKLDLRLLRLCTFWLHKLMSLSSLLGNVYFWFVSFIEEKNTANSIGQMLTPVQDVNVQ